MSNITAQYRKGGGGLLLLYKRTFKYFWTKVECVTYRRYAVETEINKTVEKLVGLTREHEQLIGEEERVNGLIKNSRQDDANFSDPFEMPMPKGSKKFKKKRGKPDFTMGKSFCALVRKHYGSSMSTTAEIKSSTPAIGLKKERIGMVEQELGSPVQQNNNQRKGNQNNQNN